MANGKNKSALLHTLFTDVIPIWWIVITGIASILSWFSIGGQTITIGLNIIVCSSVTTILFIGRITYVMWRYYNDIKVIEFQNNDNYGDGYTCVLEGSIGIFEGMLVELRRFHNGIELPFALIEIVEKNSKGQYQGRTVWIAPGHLKDYKDGNFKVDDMKVGISVRLRTIEKAKDTIK